MHRPSHEADAFPSAAGLVAGVVAPLGWGLTGIFIRALAAHPPLVIMAGRLLIACLVLGTVIAARRVPAGRPDLRLGAAMGAYYLLATEAFVRAPVVEVTLLVGTAPLIALVLELVRGVRPSGAQLAALLVTAGGLVLYLRPGSSAVEAHATGDLCALGAALVSALYVVGIRRHAQAGRATDPIALAATACALGALAACLGAAVTGAADGLRVAPASLGAFVALGVVSTAAPTLAYGVASARLPSVLTTSLGLLTPVFAGVFAGVLLGEWPAAGAVPGIALTLVGLVLLVLAAPRRSPVSR